jgi:hypothetical protein
VLLSFQLLRLGIYSFVILNMKKIKPIFNKRIFWDTNFDAIDYDKNYRFVIERVFERGDVEDIRQCRRYYGDSLVAKVLLKAKFLPERRLHLAAAVINKPITDFRCYTLRQLNQGLYPY